MQLTLVGLPTGQLERMHRPRQIPGSAKLASIVAISAFTIAAMGPTSQAWKGDAR